MAFKVTDLETASRDNNRKVNQIAEDVEAQKKNIVQLFTLSDEFRKEMDELGEQVAELYLLKKSINVSDLWLAVDYTVPHFFLARLGPYHRSNKRSLRTWRRGITSSARR